MDNTFTAFINERYKTRSDLKLCEICAIEGYPYDEKTRQTGDHYHFADVGKMVKQKESEPMKRTWKDIIKGIIVVTGIMLWTAFGILGLIYTIGIISGTLQMV